MSSTDVSTDPSTETPRMGTCDMKLEVVTLPVSDVDRAKRFYQGLGWRLDADIVRGDNFRVVQLTPPHSACSIAFGKGVTTGEPGSVKRLLLAVDDIDAAREDVSTVRRRGQRGVPPRRRTGAGSGPARSLLPDATPRSAIPTATSGCCRRSRRGCRAGSGRTDDGHRFPGRPTPRNGRPSRPVREEPCPAQLVGLVRRLHGRARARQHSDEASEAAGRYMEEVLHVAAL